jgi:hypothetical protein
MKSNCGVAMKTLFYLVVVLAGTLSPASGQQLAPEGRGLLPGPTEAPTHLGGVPPPHPFEVDASGALARTVFTSSDAKLPITVRQISIPPDRQTRTLNVAPFAQIRRQGATELLANKELIESPDRNIAVPPNTLIEATNKTETATVLQINCVDHAPEDFLERHRLIVVIADVH